MAGLTTHVLDTALGLPAKGVMIDVFRIQDEVREYLKTVRTNADGRVDGGPILPEEQFTRGQYELVFHAGAYLKMTGQKLPDLLFLDMIPIRFGVADPKLHYHVPLLLSPFGYSTYRGS
ncbi:MULTISPECIES: hydroxyisourate hydrolase [unclassified Rhizobium]|uniref:hydroxyisourate hydrolase n=1 Tax=unclassified Rhizobium TaxID=2613769 RepID=UPI0015FFE634|nr:MULTISPECIES: hydroxyisourate hydrolase [unclassified Rhizobium]MBB1248364.1 hydroxyisourate hydrolase [Rhizobium sp. G21]MCV3766706.1 hydroxyisourate hydrolase [Rhizobium sp. TRM95796]